MIQNPETGEIAREWQNIPTITTPDGAIWCAIEPLSGREFIASQAVQSEVAGKLVARKRTDIDATCRGVHNGTVYQVEAVLPDPESGLEFMAMPFSQGVSDGQ